MRLIRSASSEIPHRNFPHANYLVPLVHPREADTSNSHQSCSPDFYRKVLQAGYLFADEKAQWHDWALLPPLSRWAPYLLLSRAGIVVKCEARERERASPHLGLFPPACTQHHPEGWFPSQNHAGKCTECRGGSRRSEWAQVLPRVCAGAGNSRIRQVQVVSLPSKARAAWRGIKPHDFLCGKVRMVAMSSLDACPLLTVHRVPSTPGTQVSHQPCEVGVSLGLWTNEEIWVQVSK